MSALINELLEASFRDADREFPKEDPGVTDQAANTAGQEYLAFLSYSHADERIAATTHKFLERFRVPRSLVGRETEHGKVPPRMRPVFRDQEEFPASADLGRTIRKALGAARTLIVICSPRSARSHWVGEEIRYFKQLGRSNRIYCLIADGEPVDAGEGDNDRASFHPALFEQFDDRGKQLEGKGTEPLAVDLNEGGLSIAGVKLAAGVLDVSYDDLYQRVRRQKFRNRSLLTGLTAVVLSAGGWLFVDGLREKQLSRAQQLSVEARQEVYATQPLAGLALALHAVAVAPKRGKIGNQTILETALDLATRGRLSRLGDDVENVVRNADGTLLAVDHSEANGELRSGTDGELIQELTEPIYVANFLDHAPGYLIADYRWSRADLRLAGSGVHVAELKSPVSEVTFGPDHFFVKYSGHPSELRRIGDGALVPLAEGARADQVAFSRSADVPLVAIDYYDNPSELRRTDDGSPITLNGNPTKIRFSEDIETSRILVTYDDGFAELLRMADLALVRRFDRDSGRVSFVPGFGGRYLHVRRDSAAMLLRSSDGSLVLAGHKIVRSRSNSHIAVLAEDRVEWFRSQDDERLGSVQGDFKKLKFGKDRPPSRLALQRNNRWELRDIEDGSLIMELSGADIVDLDAEFVFVSRPEGAEIRRLDDGSLVSSLGEGVTGASYPSSGLVQVRLDGDLQELRRLSDNSVIKAPVTRAIESGTVVGPGSEYQLIHYVSGKSELKRSVDGTTVMEFGAAGAELKELTFFPKPGPSHVLARYEEGSSSLITLNQNGDAVPLHGTAVSIDLLPSEAARYLIIRYDDGRAEVWSGLEDIRRLGNLETNLQGFSLTDANSALTVWYANGHADVLDLDWLERATAEGITTDQLFALACQGPLAGFDTSVLDDRLIGETWRGCDRR